MKTTQLATELVALLKAQGKRITTVESCTGGLAAAAITSVSGSSDVFDCGLVTYANSAKTAMAGVSADLLDAHGAVSMEVAAAMAEGGRKAAAADMGLSITGIAGPSGGSLEKPVGMVCFGLSFVEIEGENLSYAQIQQFGNIGRDKVREKSVEFALKWAIDTLKAQKI